MTLAIYGGVIPYVYPLSDGKECEVRIDVIDSDGNTIAGFRKRVWLYFKSHHLAGGWSPKDQPKAIALLTREVTSRLIQRLKIPPRSRKPAPPAKAPPTKAPPATPPAKASPAR